jgi:hypothetical protein
MKGKHQLNNASVMSDLAFMVDFIHLSVCVEVFISPLFLGAIIFEKLVSNT